MSNNQYFSEETFFNEEVKFYKNIYLYGNLYNDGDISAGTITATSLVKSEGTSSQFLKADGSVDSNTYITSSSIGNGTLTLAVSGTGLSGSTSFTANQYGDSTFTVTSNATSSNTGSTIVARDSSGNFSAGLITSGTAFRVGNANLSSGGDYAHLATYEYYNGSSWVYQSATAGGLYQIAGQAHNWYKHNGSGTHTTLLTLDSSGNLVATANVTAYSDIKLKENINVIENALDKTLKLRGVTFTRKDIPKEGIQIGLIAQEVEDIIPEAVRVSKTETPEGTVNEIKTVAYGNMIGLLIEAVKDQQKIIEKLEKRIEYLENN